MNVTQVLKAPNVIMTSDLNVDLDVFTFTQCVVDDISSRGAS